MLRIIKTRFKILKQKTWLNVYQTKKYNGIKYENNCKCIHGHEECKEENDLVRVYTIEKELSTFKQTN